MNTNIQNLHQAWHQMFLHRTCPPLSVLKNGGQFVEQHLMLCPDCQANLANISDFEAAGAMLAKITFPKREMTKPVPGDIRRIRPKTKPETWFDHNGRYYNPPEVLVLTEPDEHDYVRVAQIFSGADLSFANDINLDADEQEFAEAWNVYELPVSALAPKSYRKVEPEVAERVLLAAEKEVTAFKPGTTLFYFHKCEQEMASFFQAMFSQAEKETVKPQGVKVVFFKRANATRSSKSLLSDNVIQKMAASWPKYVEELPLAAADSLGVDDGCDQQMNLPCLLVSQGADNLSTTQQTIPAEVHIFHMAEATVCTAYCRLPVAVNEIGATVTCNDATPKELSVEEYPGETNLFCINAMFVQPNLDVADLHLTMVYA